jgi:TonB-dependent receptor
MYSSKQFFKISAIALGINSALFNIAGAQQVTTDDSNIAASEDSGVEVIQVRGIRSSQVKALNEKRFANTVSDSISSTDIGKLPDATIADSLQRITGVQINRSGGEGTSVNIRGISQVGTTLNGEQMLSASSITTVQPNFTDIPASMVSGLDVYKSREAGMISSGMSGVINLRTYRPFDLEEGLTLNTKVELTDGSMGDETDKLLTGFIGYNKDSDFGATLSLTVSDKNLADYLVGSTGQDWGFVATERDTFVESNVDANGNGSLDDTYYAFQGHQAGNQFISRERVGVNGAFQWQATDSIQLIGEVFYTDMEELGAQASFIASQAWQGVTGWFTPTADGFTAHENLTKDEDGNVIDQGGAFNSFHSGTLQARRTMAHSEANASDRESLNTNLELKFDVGDSFTGSFRWVHGEAKDNNALSTVDSYINSGSQVGATFKGEGGVPVSDVNPWGYDGQSAQLPDGSVAGDFTMIPIGIQYTGDHQIWNLPSTMYIDGQEVNEVFGSNIARYSATSSSLNGANREADLDVLRFDGNYIVDWKSVATVDFGVRYAKRNIEQNAWIGGVARTNAYGDAFLSRWKDSASQAPQTLESFISPISFESLNERGMITQISDFQGASGLGSIYFVDPQAMADPLAWHNDVYGVNIQSPDGANSYDLDETTQEAYFQANLDGEIAGMSYRGNIGLRYVKTELDINQSELATNGEATYNGVTYILSGALGMLPPASARINTTRDYSDVLPSINLTLNLTDDQLIRFSYTKTVTPHNSNNLAGGINVSRVLACDVQAADGSDVFCAISANQQGNPQLEPWRSTNLDLSYEWYFSDSGILSVAAFYIDIESFIKNTTVFLPITDSDGVVRGYDPETTDFTGLVRTTTIGNGQGASVEGIEFGYQQGFDFLDGIWSNFGINANYTYSPSTSDETDYYGDSTPMLDNSEHQANLALWYEDEAFQARIAANYRSKTFLSMRRVGDYELAKYMDATMYIDASLSYDVNENFTVSLQGLNLTEETRTQYFQWEDMLDKRFYNERRITLGVQYRM